MGISPETREKLDRLKSEVAEAEVTLSKMPGATDVELCSVLIDDDLSSYLEFDGDNFVLRQYDDGVVIECKPILELNLDLLVALASRVPNLIQQANDAETQVGKKIDEAADGINAALNA